MLGRVCTYLGSLYRMHRIMAIGEVLCVWCSLELSTAQVADSSPVSILKLMTFNCNFSYSFVSFAVFQMFGSRAYPKKSNLMRREIQGNRSMRILGS